MISSIAHLRRKHKYSMYDLCQLPNVSCWISQDIRGLWKRKMVADFVLISEKQDKSKSIYMWTYDLQIYAGDGHLQRKHSLRKTWFFFLFLSKQDTVVITM